MTDNESLALPKVFGVFITWNTEKISYSIKHNFITNKRASETSDYVEALLYLCVSILYNSILLHIL